MVGTSRANNKTQAVSKRHPCSVCTATSGCSYALDGLIFCRKRSGEQPGFVHLGQAKGDGQYHLYRREDDPILEEREREYQAEHRQNSYTDWPTLAGQYQAALTPRLRDELAGDLGVPTASIAVLGTGWRAEENCWTFPERDAAGTVVGILRRYKDGKKVAMAGGNRGLHIPSDWRQMDGPVLLPEGPTNVLACRAMGLCAIGRPSNRAGTELLAGLLRDVAAQRECIVVGDFDPKFLTGEWPGRDGARATAEMLSQQLGRLVPWCLPPDGMKDVRKWFNGLSPDLTCQDEMEEVGLRLQSHLNTYKQGKYDPAEPAPDEEDATVADLIAAGATVNWAWKGWLSIGELAALCSDPGIGKTRLCADLIRRVYHGLPWPDGSAATFPAGSRTLWVAADCQYRELTRLAQEFGIPPETMVLNAPKSNPFGGTMLDSEEDLKDFEARIARVKPALVLVDTTQKATDRTAHKPEDAKAFFKPLQEIAARQQVLIVGVTHLNADGKPIGRRIESSARVVSMMECPDPEGQPKRRKLYVRKSHSLYPSPLGVTMGDAGNDYDDAPPATPGQGPASKKNSRSQEVSDWLREYLAASPAKVQEVRDAAERKGISSATLYKAKNTMPIAEYEQEGKKWWRLTTNEEHAV
jgi:hypothetical protein